MPLEKYTFPIGVEPLSGVSGKNNVMKHFILIGSLVFAMALPTRAQTTDESTYERIFDSSEENETTKRTKGLRKQYQRDEIRTLFGNRGYASGGYGAISNKFSTINGEPANIVELYGGWYVNHWFFIGAGGAASTNNIPVPHAHRTVQNLRMSYEYGQAGLMTEYIIASNRAIHLGFQLFAGGGFTLQYDRQRIEDNNDFDQYQDYDHDVNWFPVVEPGVKVEMNVFRWLRLCPGVSYRLVHGSDGRGLNDDDINGMNVNITMKIGKF